MSCHRLLFVAVAVAVVVSVSAVVRGQELKHGRRSAREPDAT